MHLNDNIAAALGHAPRDGQAFGIELEFENYNGYDAGYANWAIVRDGSLRNEGIEFVSNPLAPDQLKSALEEVEELIEKSGVEANDRCGVHVHLNMLPFSWAQLWNLSVAYTLLEPTIFKQYAPDRMNNHFCVPSFCNNALSNMMMEDVLVLRNAAQPVKDEQEFDVANVVVDEAEENLDMIQEIADAHQVNREVIQDYANNQQNVYDDLERQWMQIRAVQNGNAGFAQAPRQNIPRAPGRVRGGLGGGPHQLRVMGSSKYCALNYARLHDLGTIEFRQYPATMDMGEVQHWAEFLARLQTYANGYADPLDIIQRYEEHGLAALRNDVGLQEQDIDEQDQSDAEDAATFMAGYKPPKWEDLEWELPKEVA